MNGEKISLTDLYSVTEDNYHIFLTYHGRDPEVARDVVERYDNEEYRQLIGICLWVDASKMVLEKQGLNSTETPQT